MKFFRRILWNGLAVTSALLFIATCMLWVRSDTTACAVQYARKSGGSFSAEAWNRNLCLGFENVSSGKPSSHLQYSEVPARNVRFLKSNRESSVSLWGFQWRIGLSRSGVVRYRLLIVPGWSISACLITPPLCWLFLRKRRQKGCCVMCGYDLRATPEDQSRYPLNYASRL